MNGIVAEAANTGRQRLPAPLDGTASTNLEVFRVLALVIITASHVGYMGLPTWLGGRLAHVASAGWFGTDMFLALSGFLCARTLLPHGASPPMGPFAFGRYLVRRAKRILPAYWAFLALYLYGLPLLLTSLHGEQFLPAALQQPGAAYGAAAPSLWLANANLYWLQAEVGPGAALEAMFTIGLGVQATLMCGAAMALLPRRAAMASLCLLWVLTIGTRLMLFQDAWPYGLYIHPFARIEPFILGALLWVLQLQPEGARLRSRVERTAPALACVLWLLVLVLGAATNALDLHRSATKLFGYSLVSLASIATLRWLLNGARLPAPLTRLAALGPLVYCMFLVKLPWFSFLDHRLKAAALAPVPHIVLFLSLGGGGTLLLGLILRRTVERPLSRGLHALPSYQIAHASLAGESTGRTSASK